MPPTAASGLRAFFLMWLGVSVSLAGSQLTGFALGVSVYQRTGSVTLYGLVAFANVAPLLLAGPLAGVLVDRWDRRTALLVAQGGAGACSLAMAALASTGALGTFAILLCVSLASLFNALQFPAFFAATTLLVPREQLGRANGLVQLGLAGAQTLAPAAGGALLKALGLAPILLIDVASFAAAILLLSLVRVPPPAAAERRSTGTELRLALGYLRDRPGLLALLLFAAATNFAFGMVQVLFGPLVLGFADARMLGAVVTVGGVGMVAGSVTMLAWGGPRRRVPGILGFTLFQGLLFLLGAARPSLLLAAAGAFGVMFTLPLITGCAQTLWQRKVPPSLQGRVFALRSTVAGAALPAAFLLAGPLCDRVAEPLMAPGGALSSTAGRLLGTGAGRGAALLFVALGGLTLASVLAGALYPRFRRVEAELPDHAPAPPAPPAEAATRPGAPAAG